MKLFPTIQFSASRNEFCFQHAGRTRSFVPIVYLSPEMRILAVGESSLHGGVGEAALIFDDSPRPDNSFDVLEAMMRYGVREMCPRGWIGTLTVRISIDADLRRFLRGFGPALFSEAARRGGAGRIIIQTNELNGR